MHTVLGLDRLDEFDGLFRNRKIGLITNYSGVNSRLEVNVDLFLQKGYQIQRIFTPEHGMFGKGAGEAVDNDYYPQSHIPMISLFGAKLRPTEEELSDLDLLVYDIQDVGLRYYTYIYTLTYCMEAAAHLSIPFVVLDRPNPLGNRIIAGGGILPEYCSFIGDYDLPVRYGLTPGEVGYYFIRYKNLQMDYQVISLLNYDRDTYFSDQEAVWNIPSPALPDFDSTICYSGGCFAGATTLSEGRGSSKPFQQYGAPFIRMDEFYNELKQVIREEDVIFRKRAFVPGERKYQGQVCFGVEFAPLDKKADFIPVILKMLRTAAKLYPEQFGYTQGEKNVRHMRYLTGDARTEDYLDGRITLEELLGEWKDYSTRFEQQTLDIRIYK